VWESLIAVSILFLIQAFIGFQNKKMLTGILKAKIFILV